VMLLLLGYTNSCHLLSLSHLKSPRVILFAIYLASKRRPRTAGVTGNLHLGASLRWPRRTRRRRRLVGVPACCPYSRPFFPFTSWCKWPHGRTPP
jgi:hypothetical protein